MSKVKPKYESGRLKSIVIARPAAIPSPLTGRSSPIPPSLQNPRPLKSEETSSSVEQVQHSSPKQANVVSSLDSEVKPAPDDSSTITTFLSNEPIGPAKPVAPLTNPDPKPDSFETGINQGSFYHVAEARTSRKLPPTLFGPPELSIENVLLPADLLSQTPSMKDGLDAESEIDLRILGCELIQTSGILLKLPQVLFRNFVVL